MQYVWTPAVKRAGLAGVKVTPKSLRASHATWALDDGSTIMEVAVHLGHNFASVTTTHYARYVEGRDTEIAERMDATARATAERAAAKARQDADSEVARARGGHAAGTRRLRAAP